MSKKKMKASSIMIFNGTLTIYLIDGTEKVIVFDNNDKAYDFHNKNVELIDTEKEKA